MVHVKRFDVGQSHDVRRVHFLCDETKRKNLTKSEVKPVDPTKFSQIFLTESEPVKYIWLNKLLIQNYITKMIRRIISGFFWRTFQHSYLGFCRSLHPKNHCYTIVFEEEDWSFPLAPQYRVFVEIRKGKRVETRSDTNVYTRRYDLTVVNNCFSHMYIYLWYIHWIIKLSIWNYWKKNIFQHFYESRSYDLVKQLCNKRWEQYDQNFHLNT